MDRRRQIIAEGLAGIISSVPEQCMVVVNIEHLPRDTFEALRRGAPVLNPISGFWMANVELSPTVILSISTVDPVQLRSVS